MTVGTPEHPLRIAIVGSGPSGFYAADALQRQSQFTVTVDMFDRLATPHGLVRGGVAPDHQKIKSVTKVYDRIAEKPGFRFFGNVEFGTDVTLADMQRHYHLVIFATGAQSDRKLGIPGEDLTGSHAATDFVAWYNGHPDYQGLTFDFDTDTAIVVGNGNVAMDVARILASTHDELARTDISDTALEALANSRVRRIVMLGRRGPAQAAFTNPELKELGELEAARVFVPRDEADLDELSRAALTANPDRDVEKNVQTLMQYAEGLGDGNADVDESKPIVVELRFLVSPVSLNGTTHVESVTVVKNELTATESGDLRPRATDQTETIPAGLVFRSIGYQGVPLAGVPFDAKRAVIPNDMGRVLDAPNGQPVTGLYAVGWIKRGPSGIIGTNKPDAQETVERALADVTAGAVFTPSEPEPEAVTALLEARGVRYVTYAEWQQLDAYELAEGAAQGRPRVKLTDVDAMLTLLNAAPEPAGD